MAGAVARRLLDCAPIPARGPEVPGGPDVRAVLAAPPVGAPRRRHVALLGDRLDADPADAASADAARPRRGRSRRPDAQRRRPRPRRGATHRRRAHRPSIRPRRTRRCRAATSSTRSSSRAWPQAKVPHAPLSTDEEFVRRVYLDVIGLPPSSADVRAFVADRAARQARSPDRPPARQRRVRRAVGLALGRPAAHVERSRARRQRLPLLVQGTAHGRSSLRPLRARRADAVVEGARHHSRRWPSSGAATSSRAASSRAWTTTASRTGSITSTR